MCSAHLATRTASCYLARYLAACLQIEHRALPNSRHSTHVQTYARMHLRARRRFEELQYADEASYMAGGKVTFTGKPEQLKLYMRKLGAPI